VNPGKFIQASESVLSDSIDVIARLVWDRTRFENWLQVELLKNLEKYVPSIQIEKAYSNSQERCDFWWAENGGNDGSWLELKLCVTNYCSKFASQHKTRPITNQISDILRDAEKLRRIPEGSYRDIVLLCYPLPDDYQSNSFWHAHMQRLQSVVISIDEAFVLKLSRQGQSCNLVCYELKL